MLQLQLYRTIRFYYLLQDKLIGLVNCDYNKHKHIIIIIQYGGLQRLFNPFLVLFYI